MAYISTVNGQSYRLEITNKEQPVQLTLDGEAETLDWQQLAGLVGNAQGGHYSLLIAGKSYDIYARNITRADEKSGQKTYEIFLNSQRFEVKVEDERTRLLSHLASSGSSANTAHIEAPMPGLVIGLPFETGAEVNAGQTVVVLEAMKMENDLATPLTGILKELRVSKGQTVDQGEVLAVIESIKPE